MYKQIINLFNDPLFKEECTGKKQENSQEKQIITDSSIDTLVSSLMILIDVGGSYRELSFIFSCFFKENKMREEEMDHMILLRYTMKIREIIEF